MNNKIYNYLSRLSDYELDELEVEVYSESGKLTVLSVYLDQGKLVIDVDTEENL